MIQLSYHVSYPAPQTGPDIKMNINWSSGSKNKIKHKNFGKMKISYFYF
jgi:hypothetical protein